MEPADPPATTPGALGEPPGTAAPGAGGRPEPPRRRGAEGSSGARSSGPAGDAPAGGPTAGQERDGAAVPGKDERSGPARTGTEGGAQGSSGAEAGATGRAGHGADPLDGFVSDPAARAELARRTAELAGLVDEAGDVLGGILAEFQRGRDSAERNRGANRSST